jgi:hypothetical protein
VRLALLAAGASLFAIGPAADAAPDVDACRDAMTAQWREATAVHPIDSSRHIPVVLINVPTNGPPSRYRDAIRDLKHAFLSFKESPGSGILTGCCAVPVFGSISFDELTKLSTARFAPLCEVGDRSFSTFVQVRMEFREPYERGIGAAPYFWISY